MADPWPMHRKFLSVPATLMSLLLLLSGCTTIADFFRQQPQALPPASELYAEGESQLNKGRFEEARTAFRKVAERHPQSSYAPRARFLVGEAFYREGVFDKAIKEFEGFMAFYPRHQIADLVQYRLAMSYYDQMKPVEQDQGLTVKAMEQFRKLVREYPDTAFRDEAHFRRGEMLFTTRQYAAADDAYATVLKSRTTSVFTERALYMRGWSLFKQGKLAEGAKAPRQFLPHGAHAPIRSAQMRLKILRDWETVGAKLLATIHPWPESDLDRCLLPHPLLGKLTVREMIFFTLYHNLHHVQNVQRRRAAA